ncbi:hypothetical protein Bbelb_176060 [Branchiostoma belcheri]|nr:hypothetical protein Bbelb_176060 [Branchiostoma belcheri]
MPRAADIEASGAWKSGTRAVRETLSSKRRKFLASSDRPCISCQLTHPTNNMPKHFATSTFEYFRPTYGVSVSTPADLATSVNDPVPHSGMKCACSTLDYRNLHLLFKHSQISTILPLQDFLRAGEKCK